jgi:hypothetical protein
MAAMVAITYNYIIRAEKYEHGVEGAQAGRICQGMAMEERAEDGFYSGCVWS